MSTLKTPELHHDASRRRWSAGTSGAGRVLRTGRAIALTGVVLPLLLIGGLKFTNFEIQALKPMIGSTPWLAWLYRVFGEAGAAYFLGMLEITTGLLLLASPWSVTAGVTGGVLGSVVFLGTCSLLAVTPIWETAAGGFPALSGVGQFLIKDVALLGISLTVLGENLARVADRTAKRDQGSRGL